MEEDRRKVFMAFVYPMIGLCGLSVFIGSLLTNGWGGPQSFQIAMTNCCAVAVALFGGYFLAASFLALKEKPHCRAFLCGGEFHASNAIFKPIDFQQTLNNFCPDIAFYSAAGVHVSKGATCFNLEELPVKHWAMSMAQKHVLVVDHSKFGKVRPARMGDLKRFDIVVSDCCPEDEYVKYAQTQRIKLMY